MRSNPRAARRSDPGGISLLLALFLGALIAFWVLDVLVNLKLASAPFLGNELLGRPVDFFGLFIGGAQIAAVVAVGAWLAGTIIGTLVKRTSRRAEAVAALGAAAVALGVLAQSPSWSFVFRSFVSKVAFAGASGLVVWIPLRLLARRREAGASHLELVVQWVVVPTLVVGFALHGAKQGMHGSQAEAVVAGLWAVVLLAVCLACAVVRPGSRVVYAAWFPVVVALFMAGHSCYAFRTFGAPEPKGTVERVGSDRPAIFLIVMDTVRADHMKCFGYNRDTMPALEQWASGGATASRAISPAGWTTPAHASVFSGRTVSGHGVHYRSGTGMDHKLGTTPREGITWLPELLQDEGYYCLAASANALAFPEGIQGFDRMLSP